MPLAHPACGATFLEVLMVRVSFVIPVRDDAPRLERCLESIGRLHGEGISKEVIVVDNGSTDKSIAVAVRAGARVISLLDVSVARLRNHGPSCGSGEIIAFVDADHVLGENWLEAGTKAIMQQGVAVAGAPYQIPEEATWVQRAYNRFRRHPSAAVDVDWLGSGNMLVRREVFVELGGFDENLVTCEDVDFCNRARVRGWRVIAEPGMRSTHLGDPATLKGLFFSELWRGRDNWRVTIRGPLSFAAYASLVIPALNLLCLAMLSTGIILFSFWHLWPLPVLAGLSVFVCLAALQAARLSLQDVNIQAIAENVSVAAVYNLARALALIARATHKRRRCNL
jgi:GT2 family glycosyltransferase